MLKILTLNWNGKDKILKLYQSMQKYFLNTFEWYIKDNGSTDDSIKEIESWNDTRVNLIKYPHNRDNFSQGCNFLFKESCAKDDDLILLLNNDIIFNDSKSIENMASIITNDNNVGVVGTKLLYTNTNRLQHAGVFFDKNYSTPRHFRPNEIDDKNSSKNREFQAITGAVWMTKASIYKNLYLGHNNSKLPGLDESYFWCFEDIDACLAIKYQMNKKIIYCGETNIYHEESATLKVNPINKLFMSHNINYFKQKWANKIKLDQDYYKDINYNLYIRKHE